MSKREFQSWLCDRGADIVIDGQVGPATESAALKIFANPDASAITDTDIKVLASSINVSTRQVRAVANVESSGGGFDKYGKPKILFERHYFHRFTKGRYAKYVPDLSNRKWGGYGKSSAQWSRLMRACRYDPDAAFRSISCGKFQVMGDYFDEFGHKTPWDFMYSMTNNEFGHYQSLIDYVDMAHLSDEMQALSVNARDNRAFARGYNGAAYAKNMYHHKLAKEMRR
jgi:hypothetical protein